MTEAAVGKVAAFITRDSAAGRELLVFTHLNAGIQVPAGTVEPGEAPDAAVLRETWEESGLSAVRIAAHLATIPQAFEPDDRMLTEPFTLETPFGAVPLTRGYPIRVIASADERDQVCYEFFSDEAGDLHADETKPGWIPRRLLTTDVQRDLYHLETTAPTPDRWSVAADGHIFDLYWTPLARDVGLIAPQAVWLGLVYDRLIAP